jgi:hypothetical protein
VALNSNGKERTPKEAVAQRRRIELRETIVAVGL